MSLNPPAPGGAVLSPIEAQRAVSVLEETVEKLTFLGSITPDVLQHRDELSKFVGDEISRIIHEQRQLEALLSDVRVALARFGVSLGAHPLRVRLLSESHALEGVTSKVLRPPPLLRGGGRVVRHTTHT